MGGSLLFVMGLLCSFFLFSIQSPFSGDFHLTCMQEVLSHWGRSGLLLLSFAISDSSNRCCLLMA